MFSTVLLILGLLLLAVAATEIFMTVLSLRGSGFLTEFLTRQVWSFFLRIHRRWPCHRLLTLLGPMLMVGAILLWYLLVISGWALVFISHQPSVINNTTMATADLVDKVYFVGATISSVGYGDYVPSRFPWTLLANISALTTTFFVTTALSYLMPVIAAALDRRQLAQNISALGTSAKDLVKNSWTEGNSDLINSHWSQIFPAIDSHALKHLVYPVLRFFHSDSADGSSARTILHLADAVFLIEQCDDPETRPPPGFFIIARSAFKNYVEQRHSYISSPEERDGCAEIDHLTPATLRDLDLPSVGEDAFAEALEEYLPLRQRLVQLCVEDGWG